MSSTAIVLQTDWFVTVFVSLDDFCQMALKRRSGRGRPSALSISEYLTIILFKYSFRINDWFHTWKKLKIFHTREFPKLPAYQNFMCGIHQCFPYLSILLQFLMKISNTKPTNHAIVDSTPLLVCKNAWIKRSHVCEGYAKVGKNSEGWFYGFKAHAAINAEGDLLGLRFTPGNCDDRRPVRKLLKYFKGICIADAGYISTTLKTLLKFDGIHFITQVKKNMKILATDEQIKYLYQRGYVECIFSVLKDKWQLYSTKARSLTGYFINVLSCLFSYQFQRLFS